MHISIYRILIEYLLVLPYNYIICILYLPDIYYNISGTQYVYSIYPIFYYPISRWYVYDIYSICYRFYAWILQISGTRYVWILYISYSYRGNIVYISGTRYVPDIIDFNQCLHTTLPIFHFYIFHKCFSNLKFNINLYYNLIYKNKLVILYYIS